MALSFTNPPVPNTRVRPRPVRRVGLLPAFLLAVLALVAAACGSDGPTTSSASTALSASTAPSTAGGGATFPVTVTGANGPVTLAAAPKKIVSISPTATEMLFAVGAGPQVVAVDDQSTFPADAPKTSLSGFQPNIEAIAGYGPDLVLVSSDTKDLVAGLGKLKIPALVLPAASTLDDTYSQLVTIGAATGHAAGTAKLVADLEARVQKLASALPARSTKLTYYHELDDTLFSATSKTFIGNVYALAGLENIADAADKDGSGYPQLSVEYLLQTNPDLIFLADTKCCGQSPEKVAARPGWNGLKAVKGGNVIGLDDDIASRWGPRVVDFLETVTTAVGKVRS